MKRWFVIFCCILFSVQSKMTICAENDTVKVLMEEKELFSQAAVLMDAESGRVLYGKKEDLQLPMASTTKIMTCIVALEEGGQDEAVTVSAYASVQPKVKLFLSKGEEVKLKDLLYSLMLESHNDSAVAIAEHIGAKILGMPIDNESVKNRTESQSKEAVKAFVRCMNEKARELQCYDTWFITTNGLDATETFHLEDGSELQKRHSTTAEELARIMSYCILHSPQKDAFLEITGTYAHTFSNEEKTRSFSCRNHNAFLNMMQGALSGKTGYTGAAGYCYVGALERDGQYFVVALLNSGAYGGSNKTRKWQDTKKLMDYGISYFHDRQIYEGNTVTEKILVNHAKPDMECFFEERYINTAVKGDCPVNCIMSDWEDAQVVVKQETVLDAPIEEGYAVGRIEVLLEGNMIACFDIVTTEKIDKKSFTDTLFYTIFRFLL